MSLFKDFNYSEFKKTKLPKDDSLQTLKEIKEIQKLNTCLLYTSPSPRDS